jgi:hypothetical protein
LRRKSDSIFNGNFNCNFGGMYIGIQPEFSYVLTGYAVPMFSVDSCTGQFKRLSEK